MWQLCTKWRKSFEQSALFYILEVGESTLQDLYLRVNTFGNRLQYDHVSQQSGKLSIQLHTVLSYYLQHINEDVDPLQFFKAAVVQNIETSQQLLVVILIRPLDDLVALEIRQSVNHLSTQLTLSLNDGFDEIDKVPLVNFSQLDYHTGINQIDSDLLLVFSYHFHYVQLLSSTLNIQFLQSFSINAHAFNLRLQPKQHFTQVSTNLAKHAVGLLFYLHKNVTPMAVCMDKIVLHQHLEKSS